MTDLFPLPLQGVRVLDLTSWIAGPFCTRLLADAGATVVKVEPPLGDPMRRWTSSDKPVDADRGSPLYQYLNAGKSSVVIDLDSQHGLAQFWRSVETCDVIVEELSAADAARTGIYPDRLRAANPTATVTSLSPWGRSSGIQAPPSELTLQALSGSMCHRGDPATLPVALGGEPVGWVAGLYAAFSIVVSRSRTEATGIGEYIDLSALHAFAHATMIWPDANWAEDPDQPGVSRRTGTQTVRCLDGLIAIGTLTPQHVLDLASLVGVEESPLMDRDELYQATAAWASRRTVADAADITTAFRLPTSPLLNGETLPLSDHFQSIGAFEISRSGFIQPASPLNVSDIRARPPRPADLLGGSGDEELHRWHESGPSSPTPTADPSHRPYEDLRIADFTSYYAPSAVGHYFASLGADVIHIESPRHMDMMRGMMSWRSTDEPLWWETSVMWFQGNVGKRSLTLDLNSKEGMAVAQKLIATCDVVTDGFTPRVMEQWGLGYEQLCDIKPDIIMMRMSTFGATGPWHNRTGYAPTAEAASGSAWMTGFPEHMPPLPLNLGDSVASVSSALSLALALRSRRQTGRGQLIDSPMVSIGVALNAEQVVEYSAHNFLMRRQGNRSYHAAPQGVYETLHGGPLSYLAVSVQNVEQWRSLCRMLGKEEWINDTRFESVAARRDAHDIIDKKIAEWCRGHSLTEAKRIMLAAGVPAAQVITNETHDVPEMRSRPRFFETVLHPVIGPYEQMTWPAEFSCSEGPLLGRHAPLFGEHNRQILAELGLSEREIDELEQKTIISSKPID